MTIASSVAAGPQLQAGRSAGSSTSANALVSNSADAGHLHAVY